MGVGILLGTSSICLSKIEAKYFCETKQIEQVTTNGETTTLANELFSFTLLTGQSKFTGFSCAASMSKYPIATQYNNNYLVGLDMYSLYRFEDNLLYFAQIDSLGSLTYVKNSRNYCSSSTL